MNTEYQVPVLAVAAIYSNLKPSARNLVGDVHKYMEEVLWKLTEDVAYAFPRLKAAMKALVSSCPLCLSFHIDLTLPLCACSAPLCYSAHVVQVSYQEVPCALFLQKQSFVLNSHVKRMLTLLGSAM